jgi:metal-dependent HD superfamily phosphatase/phosphodiesterase
VSAGGAGDAGAAARRAKRSAETMHAIISHRSKAAPFTIEGAIVRLVAIFRL